MSCVIKPVVPVKRGLCFINFSRQYTFFFKGTLSIVYSGNIDFMFANYNIRKTIFSMYVIDLKVALNFFVISWA